MRRYVSMCANMRINGVCLSEYVCEYVDENVDVCECECMCE